MRKLMLLVEHVVDNAAVNCRRVSSELVKIWWFIFVILFLFNIIYKPKRRLHYKYFSTKLWNFTTFKRFFPGILFSLNRHIRFVVSFEHKNTLSIDNHRYSKVQ